MCLAIPARVLSTDGKTADLEMEGVRLQADVSFVPEAKPGDYVMVHAGFAIQIYEEADALETLRLIREMVEKMGES